MAIFGAVTLAQVQGNTQAQLANLRSALEAVNDTFTWMSAYAIADLEALGYNAADAQSVLTAVADAHAVYLIYATGQAPSTYPQVGSPYNYSTSQRVIIGPAA
jgi:hypothetical protein